MHWFSGTTHRRRALVGSGLLGAFLLLAAFRLPGLPAPPDDTTAVLRRVVLGVQNFYKAAMPEKAYLHLDKDVYTAGETIWLRAYVVDASYHQLDTLSKVLYVELLSGQQRVVGRRQLALSGGLASGSVEMPDTLAPGTYLLRAYTSWMRNAGPEFFYTRRLQVWPATEAEAVPENRAAFQRATRQAQQLAARVAAPPDVQFFPEGGSLVEGLESVVAFKAVSPMGGSIDVSGQVLDAQDKPVATFSSAHRGMGTFRFTPAPGQRYRAVVSSPQASSLTVPLPAAQVSGYVLQVTPTEQAFEIAIRQRGSSGGPVLLLGQVRGQVGYLGQGQVVGNETFTASIPKRKFANGIVHFTLFDGQGRPLAERLAFAQPEPALRVSLTPSQASYGPREPVRVRVAVTDGAGRPVAAQLSLAVADAGTTSAGADNIASRLLLTSDLAGYVEDPGYYFQSPSPETTRHLDQLLLTQGWRRFAWEPVLAGKAPTHDYGVERSLGILGQVVQANGMPSPGSTLTFLQAKPAKLALSTETDAEGRFLLNGLGGCDTIRATLQAISTKGKRNLAFRLDPGPALPRQPLPPLPKAPAPALAAALQRGQEEQADERRYRQSTSVQLSTVNVRARRTLAPDTRRIYSSNNATVLNMKDVASAQGSTLLQVLQGRIPGLSVTGTEPNMQVQIRGVTSFSGSSPLFLLDGVPVTIDALQFYPAFDIESVEVLKGGQAALFGSRGSGGVVAVYTRRGNPNAPPGLIEVPGVLAVRLPAYNCPRQFYAPRYGSGAPALTRPDTRRTTLYWNPSVRTDVNGQAELTFYTSNTPGTFQLTAEGLAAGGQPALGTGTLQVQ